MGAKIQQEYGVNTVSKRQAVKMAPHAYQMKAQPSRYSVAGKVPVRGSDVSGGSMNGGGKRRPSKDLNSMID